MDDFSYLDIEKERTDTGSGESAASFFYFYGVFIIEQRKNALFL
jgi:hypothetical protein